MLLLTSTSGQVQVVTAAAALIDVHATWVDTSNVNIVPGRQNTNISTASTTVVVPSPGASTQRNLKALHIRNRDATNPTAVTVQVFDGAVSFPLYGPTTLKPGDMLQITDMGGIQQIYS